ncbi:MULTISPECIES: regulatory protein RecX [Idiomarina]|jgi:regulatory protein|uniref:regulatory protein RecX n=1 Tax=Idiomarina TaxID=135575 RepID=UPI000C66CDE7|nr:MULTISPECIES: regulatory protein RecX [Idiomarina]MBP59682.1 OraA [Idiomarina sp.]MDA6065661.1 recombination regulator RecX [Idiomarina abyssalis]QZN90142.1 recombination regulator RecX [Idiomarina abyssalis]|tara:strand:+ start:840 stop:1307 length:468 start_codon:yes stop_codon:yes gene_type:complete
MDESSEYDEKSLRDSAFRLLAMREQSRTELKRKLIQKQWPADMVKRVVDELDNEGWQSDERFAASFIREKVGQKQGRLKILAQVTQQKGVSAQIAESVLDSMEVDWFELCAELKQKKFGDDQPADEKEWSRQVRFLQQRGFTPEQIFACVNRPRR